MIPPLHSFLRVHMQKHPNVSLEYKRWNIWGHIVSHEDVKVDPNKIKASKDWKFPATIKQLRGFLGLTWYYHNFVNNYGRITSPLTTLLKKDAFHRLLK